MISLILQGFFMEFIFVIIIAGSLVILFIIQLLLVIILTNSIPNYFDSKFHFSHLLFIINSRLLFNYS